MMKQRIAVAAVVLGVAASAQAQEIFQWKDRGGNVHFSNVPTTESAPTGLRDEPSAAGTGQAPEGGDGMAAQAPSESASDAPTMSAGSTRQAREMQRRLRDIDAKLAALARARTSHAQGSAATGGVGTAATDVLSDEEQTLNEERDRQTQALEKLRSGAGERRDEVAAQQGDTPE